MTHYYIVKHTTDKSELIKLPSHIDDTGLWTVAAYAAYLIKTFPDSADWKVEDNGEVDYLMWKNSKGDSLCVSGE